MTEADRPLPGMHRAVQSLQERHMKALTEGEGRGLSTREMAAHLETESGMRDLYDACKQALGAFEHNWAINWDDLRRAIAKADEAAMQSREIPDPANQAS